MPATEAEKRAMKKYQKKVITLSACYSPGTDNGEGKRLKAYLEATGQTAGGYVKRLIEADLDAKGIPFPNAGDAAEDRNGKGACADADERG